MAPPACVGSFPTSSGEYHAGLVPGDASCECTCDPAQGIQCTDPATVCVNSNCILFCSGTFATLQPGACTPIGSAAGTQAHVFAPTPTQMGSCASHTNNTLPTPGWTTTSKACGGATTSPVGCNAGEVCAPLALAPFDKLCVVHTGDVACPNAFYAEKHVYSENFDDQRMCSSCSCGAATSTCGGEVAFTKSSCMIFIDSVSAPGCGLWKDGDTPTDATYAPTPSGSCTPAGGVLSGTVTETGPVTFCCQP